MNGNQESALQKCIEWIDDNYDPLGIIVSGSIIRGRGNTNSDLDIFVIHNKIFRQRIQKYFNNIPVEIFINNLSHVRKYFEDDYKCNRPITAHMIGTGKIVKGEENIEIRNLTDAALKYLLKEPDVTDEQRNLKKYMIASCFEDATDMREVDILTANYFLHKVLTDAVEYIFWNNRMQLPRQKERITILRKLFSETGDCIFAAYESKGHDELYTNIEKLLTLLSIPKGFFEWSSVQEYPESNSSI